MENKLKKRSEVSDEYKWDLTPIYKDVLEFDKDYTKASELIDNFKNFKATLMNSGRDLYNALEEDTKISILLDKLYMYAHLNKDSDTTNTEYQKLFGRVNNLFTKYSSSASFLIPEILKSDYSKIEKFYTEEVKLKEYEFLLVDIFRNRDHILSEKEEEIISSLSQTLSFPEDVYNMFTDADMKFGVIDDENGMKVELTDSNYSLYLKSSNRRVRMDAFKTLFKTYKDYKNTISLMLANDVKANSSIAKIKKYNSSLEASLFSDNIDISIYNNLVDTVENNLDVNYKYLKLKKEVLGLDSLHLYDVYVPLLKGSLNKEYSFDEAKDLVKNALKVFGSEYQELLDKAFNEKWIDIYPNIGKTGGAYSSGSYTTNPYILLNYQGTLNDVSTLVHELGHSMHSYYSRHNNPYQTSNYKIFVAEVASTVNELLLAYYMLNNSKDDNEKLFILNRLMELFRTTIYRQTMFARFEKEIYDKSEKGEILTPDVMCDIYYNLNKKYFGDGVIVDDEIRYEWERVPHFYYNFYVYKYATGLASACFIVNRILNGEEHAVLDYLEFLKTGGRDYPVEELKIAGVDISRKEVIESSIKMFNNIIDEFQELYKKVNKK